MATLAPEALKALLRQAPDDWADLPRDVQPAPVYAVTLAGWVERRMVRRGLVRTTIVATGEAGLFEALSVAGDAEGILAEMAVAWPPLKDYMARLTAQWRRRMRRKYGVLGRLKADMARRVAHWRRRPGPGAPRSHPVIPPESGQWRLTDQGRMARDALESGRSVPIEPVPGYARLEPVEAGPIQPQDRALWELLEPPHVKALDALKGAPVGPAVLADVVRSVMEQRGRTEEASTAQPDAPAQDAMIVLLRALTRGVSDKCIRKAAQILQNDTLTADEKLTRIDELIPFLASLTAAELGKLLGVSKQAVTKTTWWSTHRRGKTEEDIAHREERMKERGREYDQWGEGKGDE